MQSGVVTQVTFCPIHELAHSQPCSLTRDTEQDPIIVQQTNRVINELIISINTQLKNQTLPDFEVIAPSAIHENLTVKTLYDSAKITAQAALDKGSEPSDIVNALKMYRDCIIAWKWKHI